ncbi:MAG TPA: porin [Candidatus Binatia bacterium]|nr:porin [Candidatus Binatia bacterium]
MRVSSSWRWITAGLLAALIDLIPLTVLGAPPPPSSADIQSIEQQIQELQEEVRRLKRANANVEEVIDDKIRQQKPVVGYKPGGFFIQNQKGDYVLRIGGYTQLDGRFFLKDHPGTSDTFLFRRVRPILEGSLGEHVDFKIMPDFAGATFTLYDAYVDLKPFGDWAKLRVGKWKPPVGLERLQSATAINFAERAAPTNLVPNRSTGAAVWGTPWKGTLLYEVGAFDFSPDLGNVNINLDNTFMFAGRVFAQPFVTTDVAPLQGLGVGIAGSYGFEEATQTSPDLPTYRSFGQAAIFRFVTGDDLATTAIQDGNSSRFTPQAYWYWGPFGSLFEYVQSRTPVTLGDTSDTLDNHAWEVTASWVLTGEDASFRGVTPANPFDPWNGRWGAFEVVVRYDSLDIDKDAFKLGLASASNSVQRATGFGGGLNWYWNRNIKIMLDYYHTGFLKGQRGGTGNRPAEDAVIGRVQLAL